MKMVMLAVNNDTKKNFLVLQYIYLNYFIKIIGSTTESMIR